MPSVPTLKPTPLSPGPSSRFTSSLAQERSYMPLLTAALSTRAGGWHRAGVQQQMSGQWRWTICTMEYQAAAKGDMTQLCKLL